MTTWTTTDALEAERRYGAGLPLTMRQTAHVLNLNHQRGAKKGQPDRRMVLALIADGRLRVVDSRAQQVYWTVSAAEIDRYQNGGIARAKRGAA